MVHRDTWRYEDGAHSATPPFSVLGVAAEPYMSHDRRARCITEKQLRVYPRGHSRRALVYEISKSTGFQVDFGFQNGFLDFKADFWISKWISGFQADFWISFEPLLF